jgi:sugar phosphate isomerase/epimerase
MTSQSCNSTFAVDTYSYTLRWTVRDCLHRLAEQGFCEFELQMYPGHLWPAHIDKPSRRELKDYLAANGLTVTTLNMPNIDLNIAAATDDMRDMSLRILRQVVELAGDLGAEGVIIGPGKANPLFPMPLDRLIEYFYRALDELLPLAEAACTSIFVENMPFAFLPGIQELLNALDAYGDSSIGVVYDVANGHFIGEDVASALRACASRLRAIHLSDTDQSVYKHSAVGLGTVDFRALPRVLGDIGFTRRPILEIIAADPDEAIQSSAQHLYSLGVHAPSNDQMRTA